MTEFIREKLTGGYSAITNNVDKYGNGETVNSVGTRKKTRMLEISFKGVYMVWIGEGCTFGNCSRVESECS